MATISSVDMGRHAGTAEDLESWLWDQRRPYRARHRTAPATAHTQPIPDTRTYRAMRAGHLERKGHELAGHLDTREGYAVLVRTCCPEDGAR
jgi:hypothetical protein